jgi:CDP-diacylglycerol--glycerol-3-phosphate 3-phosphatidyltransferase
MFRHVPNIITAGRLVLAVLFFLLLSYYQHEGRGDPLVVSPSRHVSLLNVAFLIYLVALFSDFLDGYLARKWKVEGAFGRVVDPFVDKVLVLGSFIFFAGKNFVIQEEHATVVTTITGVAPWMVVLILSRELLVTSLRGISESGGANFAAAFSGKLKMVFQSVTILVILLYVNYFEREKGAMEYWAHGFRDICIWLTIAITLLSGISYVRRGMHLYQGNRAPG